MPNVSTVCQVNVSRPHLQIKHCTQCKVCARRGSIFCRSSHFFGVLDLKTLNQSTSGMENESPVFHCSTTQFCVPRGKHFLQQTKSQTVYPVVFLSIASKKNVHVLHVFQPPCYLLEEVHTSWYTKLRGATVVHEGRHISCGQKVVVYTGTV